MTVEKGDVIKSITEQFRLHAERIRSELPDVWESAVNVLGDEDSALLFMVRENRFFGGKIPYEMAVEGNEKKQAVMDYLCRLEHGIF